MTAVRLGPDHDLAKRLSTLEQKVQQLFTRDLLQNASIGAGGLVVQGGGSITVQDGGSIAVNGTGNVAVDGIKLTSVVPGSVGQTASGWAVGTETATPLTLDLTVPPGYSSALVMSVAQVNLYPSAAGVVYASTGIGVGSAGAESWLSVAADTEVNITPAAIQSIACAGLTSIPVTVNVRGTVAQAASADNEATINAIAIFVQ